MTWCCDRHRQIDEMQARHDDEQDAADLIAFPPADMDSKGYARAVLGRMNLCAVCRHSCIGDVCPSCEDVMDDYGDEDRYRAAKGLFG